MMSYLVQFLIILKLLAAAASTPVIFFPQPHMYSISDNLCCQVGVGWASGRLIRSHDHNTLATPG